MPETALTTEDPTKLSTGQDYAAVGRQFDTVPETVAETPPEPVEETPPEKTPEQVRQEKNDQMLAQVASSLKKLEERKEAHEAEIAGRDRPLTVAQQEEARVIKEKTERAIAKLRAIDALPEDQANVHAERNIVHDAIKEQEGELEAVKKEFAAFREEVNPLLKEVQETRALKAMKAENPDAEEDWAASVKKVLEFVGADPAGKLPEGMTEEEAAKLIDLDYRKTVAAKKKPASGKSTTAPRSVPKTTGGGTYAGQHSPGASGKQPAATGPDYAAIGRQVLGLE